MTWNPVTLPQVTRAALTVASDAIYEVGRGPADPHPPPVIGQRPDHQFIDLTHPPRHPQFVCDAGALAAWVEPSRPTGRPRPGCPSTTDWPIRLRWWICWPSVNTDGTIPVDDRQAAAVRIHTTAQAVQRALAAWVCQVRYDTVIGLTVGESRPANPGGQSAGWEWTVTATT